MFFIFIPDPFFWGMANDKGTSFID